MLKSQDVIHLDIIHSIISDLHVTMVTQREN